MPFIKAKCLEFTGFNVVLINRFVKGCACPDKRHSGKENTGRVFCASDGQIIVPLMGRGLAFYNSATDVFDVLNANNAQPFSFHVLENSSVFSCFLEDRAHNILIENVHTRIIPNQDIVRAVF